ncbi:MAG: M23 family metallopeptidase [Erythrobacter sp.]|nr:MAG: M23 family metallopeptidase [Erythrobacter sp.]
MASVAPVQSYDPRAWARAWETARAAQAAATRPKAAVVEGVPKPLLIGGGLLLAALLAVAIWFFFMRTDGDAIEGDANVAELQEALAEAPPGITRTFRLSDIGELQASLTASGLDPALVQQIVAGAAPYFAPGEQVRGTLDFLIGEGEALQFSRIDLRKQDSSGVAMAMADGQLSISPISSQLTEQIFVRSGKIDEVSLYTSVLAAGMPNTLIDDFFEALAFDFDFAREIESNDAFEIAYRQTVNDDGEPVGAPVLVYASMTTPSRTANVYRFVDEDGEPAWFDSSGQNIQRALMRTPVDGARISSVFGMRHHPIYNRSRLHGGVDFAAPTGTSIFASGSGVIEVASWAPTATRGNGSYIAIQHDSGFRTLYLHMSAFAPGIAVGERVEQGQVIGAVGSTGGSTGPHLHYEVHLNGEKLDPMTVQGSDERNSLTGDSLQEFENVRDEIDLGRQLAVQTAA